MTAPAEAKPNEQRAPSAEPSAVPVNLGSGSLGTVDSLERLLPEFPIMTDEELLLRRRESLLCAVGFVSLFVLGLAAGFLPPDPGYAKASFVFLQIATTAIAVLGTLSLLRRGFLSIVERTFSIELSLSVAIAFGVLAEIAKMWQGTAWNEDYLLTSVLSVATVISLLRYFEGWSAKSLLSASRVDLREIAPRAKKLDVREGIVCGDAIGRTGDMSLALTETNVAAETLKPGDVFRVNAGDIVPCDAAIVAGIADVAERRLGGASFGKIKSKGQEVFAGSRLLSGHLDCKVTSSLEDSAYTYFTHQLAERFPKRSPQTIQLASISHWLVLIAFAAPLIAGFVFHEMGTPLSKAAGIVCAGLLASYLFYVLAYRKLVVDALLARLFLSGFLPKDIKVIEALRKVKALALEFHADAPLCEKTVRAFEVLDERIEANNLMSTLISLFGSFESEFSRVASHYLRQKVGSIRAFEVSEPQLFEGRGMIGTIQNVELSVGSEDFIVDRGVQLQPSDIVQDTDEVVYVAVGDEIVARFIIAPRFSLDVRRLLEALRPIGVRELILSEMEGKQVDEIAKRAGLELANVFGGLKTPALVEKVKSLNPIALCVDAKTQPEILKAPAVSIALFDEILWNLDSPDIVMFNRDLQALSHVFKDSRTYFSIEKMNTNAAILLSVGILIPSCFGLIPAWASACLVGAGGLLLGLNARRMRPTGI